MNALYILFLITCGAIFVCISFYVFGLVKNKIHEIENVKAARKYFEEHRIIKTFTSGEKLQIADVVYITNQGYVRKVHATKRGECPVALALHAIKKGDLVEYSPTQNTKDFACYGEIHLHIDSITCDSPTGTYE